MPIISKETWDKFEPREKEKIRGIYSEAKKVGTRNIRELEEFFGKENLQPQPLTYDDVARELFPELREGVVSVEIPTFSEKEAEKLHAIGRMLATAKFLNKDWKPDWENAEEDKWTITDSYYHGDNKLVIFKNNYENSSIVYFRTEELAEQAVAILGEDTVRLALTTEY